MTSLKIFAFLMLLVAAFSPFSRAETPKNYRLVASSENAGVEFHASGTPTLMKIIGRTSGDEKDAVAGIFKIEELAMTGEVKYDLKALDTGIKLRNKHMRERLEVEKFPAAVFRLNKFTLPQAFINGDFDADQEAFTGELAFHDATKPVTGTVDIKRRDDEVEMVFQFKLKLTDYKIAPPTFFTVTMSNEIEIVAGIKTRLEAL